LKFNKLEFRDTLSDIKRSISKYNQAGGAEKLRAILADMVSQKILSVYTHQASNGKPVEIYLYTDSSNGNNNTDSVIARNTDDIDIILRLKIGQGKSILSQENIGKFADRCRSGQ